MATLQERLKERRTEKGYTLLELANILGVKEATVQRYESGEIKNIKHETIVKLADILNCSPQYLMGWVDVSNDISSFEGLTPKKQKLLNHFDLLNPIGQDKAIDYVSDLAENPKYKLADEVQEEETGYYIEAAAAHHKTGIYTDADRRDISKMNEIAERINKARQK